MNQRIGKPGILPLQYGSMSAQNSQDAAMDSALAEAHDLYDNAPCAYYSINAAGVFLRVNNTLLGWLGRTRDELVGQCSIRDFYTPEGQALFDSGYAGFVASGNTASLEIALVCAGGQLRQMRLSANAIRGAQGAFLMTRTVMVDVSETHQVRAQLMRALLEQEAMLNNDLIGIVKLKSRRAIWLNQAMYRIFGYNENDQFLGELSSMLYPSEDAFLAFGAAAYDTLKAGKTYRAQVQMKRKDGAPLWIDANGVLLSGQDAEFMWMLADITPIKESQARVEHLAFHDALTGLPNRLLLSDRLAQSLNLAKRQKQNLALCYLDLDGFKPVNDEYGHEAGDQLLQEVGRRLRAVVRGNDTVCRLGGDEFVLLLPGLATLEEAQQVVQRAVAEVARPYALGADKPAQVSVSVGVACFPTDALDPDNLMRHADRAMYKAKQRGKGGICWHSGAPPLQRTAPPVSASKP
jgi:diguanylate cyclase (GGDEF)-like protein/PAS domain S-box-containing protein